MNPERWRAIEELYNSASDLPAEQRGPFLREACQGDTALYDEVKSLLLQSSSSRTLLDKPAAAMVAESAGSGAAG